MFISKESNKKYQLLRALFEEMFQMNNAELDFGIYRIMNQKHKEINDFLNKDLFYAIRDEFIQYSTGEQAELEKELADARKKASEVVAPAEVNNTPIVKNVLSKIEALKNRPNAETLENDLYSHLLNFFGNYYDTGDFISKRRYRKDEYAIPYEGEEVKLYWANYDQYYIKTTQSFSNYTFHIEGGKSVMFEIREATTERDNNKTQNGKRVFMLDEDAYRIEGNTLRIFFNYVILEKEASNQNSEDETSSKPVSKKPKVKTQDDINKETVDKIFSWLEQNDVAPFTGLSALSPTPNNKGRTILEKNLSIYTAKNEFDYFIHKDLRQFLERELDFYIKTKMIYIDDFDTEDERSIQGILSLVKVFKRIAKKIIAFLSQIEDFQKKMWLKKKFVVSSEYCMTLHHVDKRHAPAILANHAQIAEWVKLGFIDDTSQVDEAFLDAHPSLVLDTAFFPELRDELIANIDDLDDKVGGLLINSENFQALNLLQERYREQVKCVYIDPPYNTENDGFLYKDSYQHSSWLAFMENRAYLSQKLLLVTGSIYTSIDDKEYSRLFEMYCDIWGENNHIATIIWEKVHTRKNSTGYFSVSHDYILLFSKEKASWERYLISRENTDSYSNPDNDPRGDWKPDPVYANNPYDADYQIKKPNGVSLDRPKGQYWRFSEDVFMQKVKENSVIWGEGKSYPYVKRYLSEVQDGLVPVTLFTRQFAGDNMLANSELDNLFSSGRPFSYPKPSILVERLIALNVKKGSKEVILDYFAGSGTTGHAVISLNRGDKEEGKRKYILVEMGRYFDTVLKPRIQKVIYCDTWRGGKPQNANTGISHIFKYMYLESYEDTMNNLVVSPIQQALFEGNENPIAKLRETYLLSYMLDMETRDSKSLLGLGALHNPFALELKIIGNDNQQTPQIVDLVETFNYLIGLHVKRIITDNGMKIVTGRLLTSEKVLIIWRIVGKHSDNDLKHIFDQDQYNPDKFDVVYVNGDNTLNIPHMRLIDEIFPELMFENKVN